jgi:hypothetical protein
LEAAEPARTALKRCQGTRGQVVFVTTARWGATSVPWRPIIKGNEKEVITMIRFFRTLKVKPFRTKDALEHLGRLVEYINSTFRNVEAEAFRNILGHEYATFYVTVDVEDYAAWEQFVSAASNDSKYVTMRKEAEPELFIEGSVADIMMQST